MMKANVISSKLSKILLKSSCFFVFVVVVVGVVVSTIFNEGAYLT